MTIITAQTKVITDYQSRALDEEVFSSKEPVVIKGLVNHWKLAEQGRLSNSHAINYLKSHYNGRPSNACIGSPDIKGRFFYNEARTELNYDSRKMPVDEVLDLIHDTFDKENPNSYYIASIVIDTHFPEFRKENDIVIPRPVSDIPHEDLRISIWIGNRTI